MNNSWTRLPFSRGVMAIFLSTLGVVLLILVISLYVGPDGQPVSSVAAPAGVRLTVEAAASVGQQAAVTVDIRATPTLPATPPPVVVTGPPPVSIVAPAHPLAITLAPAAVRQGPGAVYKLLYRLPAGQQVAILGRNEAGNWWAISGSGQGPGPFGWLEAVAVTTQGNTRRAPILTEPELITTGELITIRQGPGKEYPVLDNVPADRTYPIIGRSPQDTWWQIAWPGPAEVGWISAKNCRVSGDLAQVPLVAAPALDPTPKFTLIGPADLRQGPGYDYPIFYAETRPTTFYIMGRTAEGAWWLVARTPAARGGWIEAAQGITTGDVSRVPVVAPLPPSTS